MLASNTDDGKVKPIFNTNTIINFLVRIISLSVKLLPNKVVVLRASINPITTANNPIMENKRMYKPFNFFMAFLLS